MDLILARLPVKASGLGLQRVLQAFWYESLERTLEAILGAFKRLFSFRCRQKRRLVVFLWQAAKNNEPPPKQGRTVARQGGCFVSVPFLAFLFRAFRFAFRPLEPYNPLYIYITF